MKNQYLNPLQCTGTLLVKTILFVWAYSGFLALVYKPKSQNKLKQRGEL
jgi:hypothetical protein